MVMLQPLARCGYVIIMYIIVVLAHWLSMENQFDTLPFPIAEQFVLEGTLKLS